MSLVSTTAAHVAPIASALSAGDIANIFEHSWPVETAGGTLITVLVTWLVTLVITRKRLAWRVYTDDDFKLHPDQAGSVGENITLQIEVPPSGPGAAPDVITKPRLVVLRIRNSGLTDLRKGDLDPPVQFIFPGRQVHHAEIVRASDGAHASLAIDPTAEAPATQRSRWQEFTGNWVPPALLPVVRAISAEPQVEVDAPKVGVVTLNDLAMNRNARFTLMAVVTGKPPEKAGSEGDKRNVVHRGMLSGGRIVAEQARRGPGSRSIAFSGGVTLAVAGLLLGLLVSQPGASPATAASCVGGDLTLIGSTAFSGVAHDLAEAYQHDCGGQVQVPATNNGSLNGLATLEKAGAAGQAGGLVVMSDGPADPGQYPGLTGQAVAVIIFTVTVNASANVSNLTLAQVQQIFEGHINDWSQVRSGPAQKITVITRKVGSGTRATFDKYVLQGGHEPKGTDSDCKLNDLPAGADINCADSTEHVMQVVAGLPGSIGYVQIGEASAYSGTGAVAVSIDHRSGHPGDLGRTNDKYQFWTAEYLYTYGKPSPMASAFIAHLTSPAEVSDLTSAGYLPCPPGSVGTAATLCQLAGA